MLYVFCVSITDNVAIVIRVTSPIIPLLFVHHMAGNNIDIQITSLNMLLLINGNHLLILYFNYNFSKYILTLNRKKITHNSLHISKTTTNILAH